MCIETANAGKEFSAASEGTPGESIFPVNITASSTNQVYAFAR